MLTKLQQRTAAPMRHVVRFVFSDGCVTEVTLANGYMSARMWAAEAMQRLGASSYSIRQVA